jgi:hypothetical protein
METIVLIKMSQETTTIEVSELDVKLARRLMGEMGCKSLKELFHKFVANYMAISLGFAFEGEKDVQ